MFESNAVSHSSLFADLLQLGRVLLLRRSAPGSFSPDIGKLPGIMLLYGLFAIFLSITLNGQAGGALKLDGDIFIPFGVMALIAGLVRWVDGRLNGGAIWIAFSLLLLMLPLAGFIGAKLLTLDFSSLNALPFWSDFTGWFAGKLPDFITTLPHVWLALAGTVLVARGKPHSGWRRSLCVPLTTLALLAIFTTIHPLDIWQIRATVPPPAKATGETDGLTVDEATGETDGLTVNEDIFYGQPRILAERLATVRPGKPGVPEIFFLGLAGSEEDVFMRETIAVEQLFKDRYQTSGHSLLLVNNPSTANKLPFASLKSLSMALQRIGERMNGKEDLLFLFLTSHGNPDSLFSISLWPFEFTDIDPPSLRKALDDAGIERRVVVISACYSGTFVPVLADENTLVITAAAADRSSFGCDNSNELTDFGRAYFNEALRETRSFTEAFEHARKIIAEREIADLRTPSQPQIAGGNALREQLKWFALAPEDRPLAKTVAEKPPARASVKKTKR